MNKKKLVSLFMAVVMCFSILAQAALPVMAADTTSGTCGDTATWTLTDGVLTVSGTGAMTDYDSRDAAPWYSYRNEIVAVDISNGITHVGSYSFAGYPNITSLTMADGLETIGTEAFTAYTGETLTLPSTLQSAGSNAFATSNNLTDLYIPAAYTGDIAGVFGSCGSLQKFDVDASNTEYAAVDGNILSKDLTRLVLAPCARDIIEVPEGVTTIGEYALWGSHAVEVVIPDSVEEIEYGAFYVAQSLQSIEIPEGVTYLPGSCFGFDNSLETITLPASLTEVGSSAFEECTALSTVNFNGTKAQWGEISWDTDNESAALCPSVICSDGIITNSDTEAATSGTWGTDGTWAFENGVLTVTGTGAMPDYTWSDYAEGDAYLTDAPWMDHYKSITSVVISAGITRVGDYSFAGYPYITSLSLPEGLLAIGQEAFMLYNGEELVLPSTLEILEDEAFKFAGGVSTVNIPASLTGIGVGALSSMSGVTAFTVDDANTAYKAEDGVVYTKDGTQLVVYPCCNQVTSVTVPEGVEMIGPGAFWGNWKMTEVLLPSTLTSIAKWAFRVSGLVNLVIPDGVDYIDEYAFNNCDSLLTVAIPDSVGEIGNSAFARCTSLTTVYYDANQADWDDITIGSGNAYLTSATIQCNDGVYGESGDSGSEGESGGEESVIYMPVTCYHGTDYITINFVVGKAISDPENSSTLPTGSDITAWYTDPDLTQVWDVDNDIVTTDLSKLYASNYTPTSWSYDADTYTLTISGAGMVEQENGSAPWETYRTSIKHIVVEEGITGLGLFIFESHSGLLTVSLPDTLEYIGKEAFWNCGQLQAVEIPASVSTIGLYPFALCDNAVVTIDADNPYFEVKGGGIVTKDNGGWYEPELITILPATTGEYTVPAGVLTVEQYSGTYHEGITKVTVPSTVRYIWDGAFSSMPNLEEAYVLAELENGWLHSSAFNNCWNLKKVVLSDSITRIGSGVFDNCHEDLVIYYMGTEAQWNAITFDSAIPDTAEVICNYEYTAPAEGTLSDTINWSLVDGTLTISGTGAMPDYDYESNLFTNAPWYGYKEDITAIVIGDGITHVGATAFADEYVNLASLSLPEGLESIGECAFSCYPGAELVLPSTLTTIGEDAFTFSKNLTSLHIPANLTSGVGAAFGICRSLTEITVDAENTAYTAVDGVLYSEDGTTLELYPNGKGGEFTVPDGVTTIGYKAFWGSTANSITLPDTLTTLEGWAFRECRNLTSIIIPHGVTTVSEMCFADDAQLESIIIPASVTSIGWRAFDSCDSLTQVYYGSGAYEWNRLMETRGEGNDVLDNVNVTFYIYPCNITVIQPENGEVVTSLGDRNWFISERPIEIHAIPDEGYTVKHIIYTVYGEDRYVDSDTATIQASGDIVVTAEFEPYILGQGNITDDITWRVEDRILYIEGIGDMEDYASADQQPWAEFRDRIRLVEVSDTVTHIGAYAFAGLENCTDVYVYEGLLSLGDYALADMALTDLWLPDTVESIGAGALSGYATSRFRLPGNMSVIVTGAFNGMSADIFNIHPHVTEIADGAFENAVIAVVVYDGIEEEWNNISIGENNDPLLNAELIFEGQSDIYGELETGHAWYIDLNNYELVVEGDGAMPDFEQGGAPWAAYVNSITRVAVKEGVTYIGEYAFADLPNLERVRLFDDVEVIGSYAFANSPIEYFHYANSVTEIRDYAFSGAGDVDMNNIYFAGNRDDYSNITVGEGNDTSLYPRHIDAPANADWITVTFDTGVHGITVDPIIMVDGYHFYPDEHMPVREGYVIHSWWNNPKWVGRPYDWENDCIWGDTTFYAKWTKLKTTDGDLPENSKVTAIRLEDWEGNKLTNVKVNYFGDEYYYFFDPIVDGEGNYNNLLTVTSSNTKVAEYDPYEGGYSYAIKIKSAGTAKITFASVQNPAVKVTATITVTRRASAVDLSLSKNTTTDGAQILLAGQSYKPTVTWTGGAAWTTDSFYLGSHDENVVQFVDGKFKAVGAGRTTIYIECFDEATGMNIFDYVEVEVFTEKVKAVQLSTSKMILDANLRLPVALAADVEAESKGIWAWPSNDGAYHEFDISWTASPNIVVYSENCEAITSPYTGNMVRVLALNSDKGSITVTFKAKDGSGKSAKATVQTGVAVQEIRTTLPNVIYGEYGLETTVAVGKSIKATASVYPADATVKTLKWSAWTDDSCQTPSDIVSVKSGTIKGLKAGKAFIRVDSTDGNDTGDAFWVNVVNPATKVVITGYTEHIHYQDNISRSSLTIKVLGADGTTDGVSQDVKITLGGAIGKYVVPEYSDGNGQWNFVTLRAGKYTVKATTTDGTNKSATFTVNVEQHLFDFQPKAPKGVTAVDDSTWAVNVGTTFTPSAVYNLGEKAYAPAASAKKFTVALDPDAEVHTISDIGVALEDAVTITGIKVKANAIGEYKLVLTPVSATGCENCLDNTKEITLKVLYKNSTDLTNVAIRTNKGYIDGDTMYVRTGLKPQLTAMINGVKANTKKVELKWTATDVATDAVLDGVIDASTGKMNLTNVEPGTEININCIAYDNYDENNSSAPVVMKVIVTEKLAKADIGLLVDIGGDTTVPANEAVLTIKEGAKTARVSVKDGATPSYTFKTSNAKILAVETVSGSEIMLVPTGVGTATITVTANDGSGVKNTFKVKVAAEEAPIKAIVPLAKTFTVYGGESIAIPFTLTSAKAGQSVSNPVVQWTTSDALLTALESESTDERGPAVMTEGDGRIILYTAEKAGKVTLTGTAMDGSKKTVKITVNIVDRSSNQALFAEDGFMLTLPANTANNGSTGIPVLTWGKSLTLKTSLYPAKAKNPNILWKVQGVDPVTYDLIDNPAGITIKNGKLTVAKSSAKVTPFEGAVLVTAYTAQQYDFGGEYEPIVQTQYIQVQAPVAKVALADTTGMFPGQTKQMEPVFTYDKYDLTPTAGDYPILWSVNDKKLATIDENGVLTISETAKVGKSVKVTAATQDGSGKKVTATIKIVKQP